MPFQLCALTLGVVLLVGWEIMWTSWYVLVVMV